MVGAAPELEDVVVIFAGTGGGGVWTVATTSLSTGIGWSTIERLATWANEDSPPRLFEERLRELPKKGDESKELPDALLKAGRALVRPRILDLRASKLFSNVLNSKEIESHERVLQ